MNRLIHRLAEDGLSRQFWDFDISDATIVLRRHGVERRASLRGRFKAPPPSDRWAAMDERRYNSGLPRPSSIPHDVLTEAASFEMDVMIGWRNAESIVGKIAVKAA